VPALSPIVSYDDASPVVNLMIHFEETPALPYTLMGACLVPRPGLSARSSAGAEDRFSVATNLDALRFSASLRFSRLERSLFALELLGVHICQPLTAAPAPRTRNSGRIPAQV
jgi:hypothetical protein